MELLDRNHYRMREDSNLLEEAKYNPTAELAIILAERLDDVLFEADIDMEEAKAVAEDARLDMNQLDDKIYELQQKIDVLELMLTTRDDIIAELKEQKND